MEIYHLPVTHSAPVTNSGCTTYQIQHCTECSVLRLIIIVHYKKKQLTFILSTVNAVPLFSANLLNKMEGNYFSGSNSELASRVDIVKVYWKFVFF